MKKCEHNYVRDEEFIKYFSCQKCGHAIDEISHNKYMEIQNRRRNEVFCFIVKDEEKIQLKSYESKDDADFARLNATAQERKTSNTFILPKKIIKDLSLEILEILRLSQELGYAKKYHAVFFIDNERSVVEEIAFSAHGIREKILEKYPLAKKLEIIEVQD